MNQNIAIFLICICFILIFGKIIITPLKIILKILINSILGAFLLWIINYVGGFFWDFSVGLNIWTALLTGILGVPGAVLLILIKIFII